MMRWFWVAVFIAPDVNSDLTTKRLFRENLSSLMAVNCVMFKNYLTKI